MKPFNLLASALVITLTAGAATAERINMTSNASVATSVERLTNAVKASGARVFATVDFQQGAKSVGEDLRPTTVVIFGNHKIGSTALQEGQTMALFLPLRILFFEDKNGQTWATYNDPASVAPSHGLAANNRAILQMQGALDRFATIATGQ